jgi:hypothetical protein
VAQRTDSELAQAQQRFDELSREVHRLTQATKAKPADDKLRQELAKARNDMSAADRTLIAARSRSVRDSFNDRIAVLRNEISAIDLEIGEALLKSLDAPDDTQKAKHAEELTRSRDSHVKSIHELELARDAAERRTESQTLEARTRQLAASTCSAFKAHAHAVKQAREFVDWLSEAGVRWANAHAAVQDVERVARKLVDLAGGGDKAAKRWITSIEGRYLSPLVNATVGVLGASRMTDGALAPYLDVRRFDAPRSQKTQGNAFDMETEMAKAFRRQLEALAEFDPDTDPDAFFPGTPVSDDFYDLGDRPAKAKARA